MNRITILVISGIFVFGCAAQSSHRGTDSTDSLFSGWVSYFCFYAPWCGPAPVNTQQSQKREVRFNVSAKYRGDFSTGIIIKSTDSEGKEKICYNNAGTCTDGDETSGFCEETGKPPFYYTVSVQPSLAAVRDGRMLFTLGCWVTLD